MKMQFVIPHLGASTVESEDNCAIMQLGQLTDFIENGNIKKSVNYPNCDMGFCTKEARALVQHKKYSNMISQFTTAFAKENINISDMINKSKGDYAYTVLDLDGKASDSLVERIKILKRNRSEGGKLMAIIKPFKCIRPDNNVVSKVAALPYDVYNRKEAVEVVRKENLSFLKIDRAETSFDDSVDIYDDRVYKKAKEILEDRIKRWDIY